MRKLLALTFVIVLVAAACGGDDDGDTADDQAGTPADTGDGAADGDGTGDEELDELLARARDVRIRVTYETDDGETITVSQDGEGRSAVFPDESSVMISTDDGTVVCDGLDGDAPTCNELPGELGDLTGAGLGFFFLLGESLSQAADELEGIDRSRDEIAGRDAICWDIDPSRFAPGFLEELGDDDVPDDARGRVCIDEETGFLLEIASESDGEEFFFRAVEVGEPDDDDFEPPVEPEPAPDFDLPDDIDIDELLEQNS